MSSRASRRRAWQSRDIVVSTGLLRYARNDDIFWTSDVKIFGTADVKKN
ncbi:hypothetical protein KJ590_02100 [Patescibacteria group bacterium]|nr:hypothetical protein [Patescibacteria group bacterium]